MASSLFTALSGLRVHQGWIDVVGNNIANASTPGYKSSRAVFSDNFAQTLRFASGPSTNTGGINPLQIGRGVQLADIGRTFSQGALTNTGRTFDLAMQGQGMFALTDGTNTMYTRVGTFGLDAEQNLVDQRTGFRVLDSSGTPVTLDLNALLPANPTQSMEFQGNLPATVTGPLQEVLTSASAFTEGSPAMIAGANVEPFAIPLGETWTMNVSVDGGAAQQVSVPGSAGPITAATIATAIDGLSGISATDVAGAVQITTDRTGESVSIEISQGSAGQDLAGLLGLSTNLVTGSEIPVSGTTDLNQLPGNVTNYVVGDGIDIAGVDTDGTPINATFTYGVDGTTVGELETFLDGLYTDATVAFDASGMLTVTAGTAGESNLFLSMIDDSGAGQVGGTNWVTYALGVTTAGTGPDVVTTSMEVYDSSGTAHTMSFDFERQQDETWTMTASVDAAEGTILSAPITGIDFGDDGSPTTISGLAASVTVQFTGQSTSQDIALDLGTDGEFGGLTQFGADANAYASFQDGYGVGEVASISVDRAGSIQGFYTNGQVQELDQVGVATFSNPEGLLLLGNNLWLESPNSGSRILGAGDNGTAGQVIGGSIENSNVDTAEQFVQLIEAQRGFQANARVITTQDEVLAELVNLI